MPSATAPHDPVTEKLIGDLRRGGLQVPDDITRQLSHLVPEQP